MGKHLQDPKTGKFAIGDGKTSTPSRSQHTPKPVESSFLKGKPDWFTGYAKTVTQYVLNSDKVRHSDGTLGQSEVSVHMENCSVATVHNVDENLKTAHEPFTTFDDVYAACILSTKFSCVCGKYVEETVSTEATISEAMSGMFRKNSDPVSDNED